MTETLEVPLPMLGEERIILHDVDWSFYERVLKQVGDRHIFVTYDRGSIEIMSPTFEHEAYGDAICRLIWILSEELGIELRSAGSTTLRKKVLDRGLEPDKCFYVANELKIRGKKRLDLSRDPPPDLAVEVEITQRLLDREAIYRRLGVPELWRFDGIRFRVSVLARGRYVDRDRSPTFPTLPLQDVQKLLADYLSSGELAWARRVRRWVKKNAMP